MKITAEELHEESIGVNNEKLIVQRRRPLYDEIFTRQRGVVA